MRHAVEEGGDYVTYDLRFHQGLLRACGNRMMMQMSKAIGALLRTSFEISTSRKDGPRLSLPMHRAVLDAVIAPQPRQGRARHPGAHRQRGRRHRRGPGQPPPPAPGGCASPPAARGRRRQAAAGCLARTPGVNHLNNS